jgi:hypothetical protein
MTKEYTHNTIVVLCNTVITYIQYYNRSLQYTTYGTGYSIRHHQQRNRAQVPEFNHTLNE